MFQLPLSNWLTLFFRCTCQVSVLGPFTRCQVASFLLLSCTSVTPCSFCGCCWSVFIYLYLGCYLALFKRCPCVFTFYFHSLEKEMAPTPVFLPGESQGQGSLVGCCLWGHAESDTTEATEHACPHCAFVRQLNELMQSAFLEEYLAHNKYHTDVG